MHNTLSELVKDIRNNRGTWKGGQLAYEIKMFLWKTYDPNNDLIYPVIADWDDLLELTIDKAAYTAHSRKMKS